MAIRIAVDAMGGDHAPVEIIRGAVRASETLDDVELILVGDESAIKQELKKNSNDIPFSIVHTDQWVTMDDIPKETIRSKPNSSIRWNDC